MEKIPFMDESGGEAWFYIIEETRIGGTDYILVTDSDDPSADAEAFILKDVSGDGEEEAVFEEVGNERELSDVMKIFAELLDDIDLEM